MFLRINRLCALLTYRLWQQSMYALFGTKWTKLHGGGGGGGAMWCIDPTGQEGTATQNRVLEPDEVLFINYALIKVQSYKFIIGKIENPSSF